MAITSTIADLLRSPIQTDRLSPDIYPLLREYTSIIPPDPIIFGQFDYMNFTANINDAIHRANAVPFQTNTNGYHTGTISNATVTNRAVYNPYSSPINRSVWWKNKRVNHIRDRLRLKDLEFLNRVVDCLRNISPPRGRELLITPSASRNECLIEHNSQNWYVYLVVTQSNSMIKFKVKSGSTAKELNLFRLTLRRFGVTALRKKNQTIFRGLGPVTDRILIPDTYITVTVTNNWMNGMAPIRPYQQRPRTDFTF